MTVGSCVVCGKPKPAHRKTCSTSCAHTISSRASAARKARIQQGTEQWSEAERAYHESISTRPQSYFVAIAYRQHIKRGYRLHLLTRTCPVCGVMHCPINASRTGTICSDACARLNKTQRRREYRKKHGRMNTHRRRAKRYGVRYETVNTFKVFKRDGWKCRGCGTDTPRELRGLIEPNAPELDHIIPLSRGGPHSYENAQCLCRACNGAKSAMTMDEWAMTSALVARNAMQYKGLGMPPSTL